MTKLLYLNSLTCIVGGCASLLGGYNVIAIFFLVVFCSSLVDLIFK